MSLWTDSAFGMRGCRTERRSTPPSSGKVVPASLWNLALAKMASRRTEASAPRRMSPAFSRSMAVASLRILRSSCCISMSVS